MINQLTLIVNIDYYCLLDLLITVGWCLFFVFCLLNAACRFGQNTYQFIVAWFVLRRGADITNTKRRHRYGHIQSQHLRLYHVSCSSRSFFNRFVLVVVKGNKRTGQNLIFCPISTCFVLCTFVSICRWWNYCRCFSPVECTVFFYGFLAPVRAQQVWWPILRLCRIYINIRMYKQQTKKRSVLNQLCPEFIQRQLTSVSAFSLLLLATKHIQFSMALKCLLKFVQEFC